MENRLIGVDTDVIVDFFGNVDPAAEVISELLLRREVVLTSVSVFELYAGIEGKKRLSQIDTLVQNVIILGLNVVEAAWAAKIYTQLRSRGQLIGTQDILIAGICLANGIPLYTNNVSHFSKIQNLQILSNEEILGH